MDGASFAQLPNRSFRISISKKGVFSKTMTSSGQAVPDFSMVASELLWGASPHRSK